MSLLCNPNTEDTSDFHFPPDRSRLIGGFFRTLSRGTIAGAGLPLLSILSVAWLIFKAARANPVKALKT
jgi:hypothetical protein